MTIQFEHLNSLGTSDDRAVEATVSIAISLIRIADRLDALPQAETLMNQLTDAIYSGITHASGAGR